MRYPPPNSGVYLIRCIANGKEYVGSSQNMRTRKLAHFADLRAGRHANPKIQAAFDKYGEDFFVFSVWKKCYVEDLLEDEQRAIDDLKPAFNIAVHAGAPMRGRKASPETRAKLSARLIGNIYTKGRPLSETHKAALRAAVARGKKTPVRGPLSEAHKAKISAIHKGRQHSPEHRARVSAAKLAWWAAKCAA